MLIIDAHVHLWPSDRIEFPPSSIAGHAFPAYDGAVETLVAHMDANCVDGAVIVQSPWFGLDDRYLLECISRYPDRFVGIGCTALRLEDVNMSDAALRIGRDGLHGLRLHLTGPRALELMTKQILAPVFARSAETGVPLLLIYQCPKMHSEIGDLAKEFRGVRVVLDHFAYTTPNQGASQADEDALVGLAEIDGIYLKMSAHHRLSMDAFPWRDLHGLQKRLIANFGADRLMWGSNFPMFMNSPTYEERLTALRDHYPFDGNSAGQWILGGTAARLWPTIVAP
jgi:predicted TIM-barrel fold metal-dependent hydrolase